jgi:hypothetical protein
MINGSPLVTNQSAFGRLIESLTQKLHLGQAIDWAALAREHPEHAEKLDAIRPALEALGQLSRAGESAVSGLAPPIRSDESSPDTLGDFRILHQIGRGGMGIVYEAEQVSLGRRVALKILPFAGALDAKQLQRFKNEAQAAAHLHHTNIVPVHYVGCDRGVHYYAMQLIEGQTLAEVIAELRQALRKTETTASPANSERSDTDIPVCASKPKRLASTTPAVAALTTERSTNSQCVADMFADYEAEAGRHN